MTMKTALADRVARLEALVGNREEDDAQDLVSLVDEHQERLGVVQSTQEDLIRDLETHYLHERERSAQLADEMKEAMRILGEEVTLLRRMMLASSSTPTPCPDQPTKVRVPDPKVFNGSRDSKEVKNFIWDVENYFRAMRIGEEDKVNLAVMYLGDVAKLWWRTRTLEDASAGHPTIGSWEALKKELRDQFVPCNVDWVARDTLKKLRQTGSTRDYVRDFSALLLDIHGMSERDKLFNFLSGLQPWAQMELQRQGVQDVPAAMAAVEGLIDFRVAKPTVEAKGKQKQAAAGSKTGRQQKWKKG